MANKSIPILVVDDVPRSMGMTDRRMSDILQRTSSAVTTVSSDVLQKNMASVARNFLEVCQDDSFDSPAFALDEIELALSIGAEGEVSVLSAAAAKANMLASVTLKFKRKGRG